MIDPHDLPELPALMIAGPGELHDDDLKVFGHQVLAHYGETWVALHNETIDALSRLLGAGGGTYLIPGSGSTGLEMGIRNLFAPGATVVVPNSGFFGVRLMEIAAAVGLQVREVPVEVGAPIDANRVAEAAVGTDGVISVHVETSTGVRHPIGEIAKAAHAAGGLFMVDAIASAAGEVIDVEAMGIDLIVTGTQKGLEAPPGLAVLCLSNAGRQAIEHRSFSASSWYLDIAVWDKYRTEWGGWHPHPVTMPTNIVLALASSVKRITEFGRKEWIEGRAALAKRCREGLAELGLPPVPAPGAEANLIVVAWADDPDKIQKRLKKEGIMIGGGLGPTSGKAIRIGLMGRTATEEMVDKALGIIADIFK